MERQRIDKIDSKHLLDEWKINIWPQLSYSSPFHRRIFQGVQNAEQCGKKLISSFKFSQVSLQASYSHISLTRAANLSWVYIFNKNPSWQMDRKPSGNSQLKAVLEFWNWPAHASSYIKMLGRGRLGCQDPLQMCRARTDTRSPWRGEHRLHT